MARNASQFGTKPQRQLRAACQTLSCIAVHMNQRPPAARQIALLFVLLSVGGGGFSSARADTAPVFLANPLQGTDSSWSFSHGNTYPAIALPFPMNTWAPYTQPQKDSFYYQYHSTEIRGLRETHQPSAWIPEYGAFALMPTFGELAINEDKRASPFSHAREEARPSYYKVHLDKWGATVEVTPTERAARFRFTFDQRGSGFIVLDLFPSEKPSSVEVFPAQKKIVGIARNNRGAVPDNFGNYFVLQFDQPFAESGVWSNDATTGGTHIEGSHVGAYVKFDTAANPVIEMSAASSFIGPEQAQRNLEREIGGRSFDTVRDEADRAWNDMLGRARVEGGNEEQRRTFYSALYRSVLFPHRFYELDEHGGAVYRSPYDGKIHHGHMYTDSGYWDTFRAAHPLYNLLFPDVSAEIVEGVLHAYDESGWLPQWSSPGNRNAMIGNHAFSLLADAWVKNVRSFDLSNAVDAVYHDAHQKGLFMGRDGYKDYDRLGYVPFPNVPDSAAKTLEYAYDDFCAALLAQAAGREKVAADFARSAMNYTNVFNPQVGFMQGRKADGSWREPFDPLEWGNPFVEGNPWQWSWSVMQDVPGLIKLMGGDKAFTDKLDALFAAGSEVHPGWYHGMIHEMNEMVAQNLGQYAHGNEPVHHVAYLYDYAGQPWKTQIRLRQIMSQLYQSTPDGLCGDEDTGQMSAWYVFSALGFYPVTPGTDEYAIGSPIFDAATIKVGANPPFRLEAHNNGPQRPYIKSATLDGQPFNKVFITHEQITHGGVLRLEMDSFPDYHWATDTSARPARALDRIAAGPPSNP